MKRYMRLVQIVALAGIYAMPLLTTPTVWAQTSLPKCSEFEGINLCMPPAMSPLMLWPQNADGGIVIRWQYHRTLNNPLNPEQALIRDAIENAIFEWNLWLAQYDIRFQFDNAVAYFDDCPLQSFGGVIFRYGAIDLGSVDCDANKIPPADYRICGLPTPKGFFGQADDFALAMVVRPEYKQVGTPPNSVADYDCEVSQTLSWAIVDINAQVPWGPGLYNPQNVITHELGHVLGIGHPPSEGLGDDSTPAKATGIMFQGNRCGDPTFDIDSRAVQAIGCLYGRLQTTSKISLEACSGSDILKANKFRFLKRQCGTNLQANLLNKGANAIGRLYELAISDVSDGGPWQIVGLLDDNDWVNDRFNFEFALEHPSAYFRLVVLDGDRIVDASVTTRPVFIPAAEFAVLPELQSRFEGTAGEVLGLSIDYQLSNNSQQVISWTATPDQSWLDAVPSFGALAPGEFVVVHISANEQATTLQVGTYKSNIAFESNADKVIRRVVVELDQCPATVEAMPRSLETEALSGETEIRALQISNIALPECVELQYQITTSAQNISPSQTTVGSNAKVNFGDSRYRGDVYSVSKRTTLTHIESYLNFTGTRALNFVVLEGEFKSGPFNLIHTQTVSRNGTGEGFYASGPVSQLLLPGKFYIVAVGWTGGNITFYWDDSGPTPASVSFGQRVNGYALDSFPIGSTVSNPLLSSAYYQRITTEDTWLRVSPAVGSVPSSSTADIEVVADATGLVEGNYEGKLSISSNDPNTSLISIPVTLNVATDHLVITPQEPFITAGFVGGPFTPLCKTYTLRNDGSTPINWSASCPASWLGATPSNGVIGPGESITVNVCLTDQANTLTTGTYVDNYAFKNAAIGTVQSRTAELTVGACPDEDNDGFTICTGDCNDNNPDIFPGAAEICDGLDNNCNGEIDEGGDLDTDNDGFTVCQGDFDNNNSTVFPGAPEQCDGVDNDCDGTKDEGPDCWPVAQNCDALYHQVFTTGVPGPRAIAISPGGQYGNYMYVTSGQNTIYRVAPDGTAEVFAQGRGGNGYYQSLVFDNTPSRRYGGYLYVIIDYFGGPCLAGIDRVLPNRTVEPFVNGCGGNPVLLGAFGSEIDDQGKFGYNFFLADFEVDEFGRSPSTVIQISPSGGRSPFYSAMLRGITSIDIDRFGKFEGDLIATNIGDREWMQGDNAIYRIKPDGTRSIVVPNRGYGFARDVLVDGLGTFDGNLFVLYDESSLLVEYDQLGQEIRRHAAPGSSDELAQDRWGSFNFDIFYSVIGQNEIRRLVCGQCVSPPSGLVSWWPGDGDANDIKSSNNGTLQNGATFSAGKVGQAFSFDGANDYVILPGIFGGHPEMTIDAWVMTSATTSDFQAIVSSPVSGEFVHFQLFNSGNITVYTDAGTILLPIIPQTPTGVFRHVALSIKSGDTRLYVNGTLLGSPNTLAFSTIIPTSNLHIGNGYQGRRFFQGLIDEVGIFNRALSAEEIAAIYNAGSVGKCKECEPPTADAGDDQTICPNASVQIGGDPTGSGGSGTLTLSWEPADGLSAANVANPIATPTSSTTYTVTVTDGNDCTATDVVTVTVEDDLAPVITVAGNPITLWPPNHKYVTISVSQCVTEVTDNCVTLSPSNVVIAKVTSDEPEDAQGGGDGNTINDMIIAPDCQSVQLRSERQGSGNGRVYSIHLSVSDGNGNTGTATCLVTVPHDQNGTPAVDDGPVYEVAGGCYDTEKLARNIGNITEQETLPDGYALFQNYPNPFNPTTEIPFALPEAGEVTVRIYSETGQLVRTLVDNAIPAGRHVVSWNGLNESGNTVAAGVYLYRIVVQKQNGETAFTETRRMTLLK